MTINVDELDIKSVKKGQSVTATITTAKAKNAVLVPVSAIQTKDGESYVTVVTDDNENGTQTKVETGIINDTYAQITSGVSEGDQVKTITRSSSSSDEKSDMKGGMNAPSGGGMHWMMCHFRSKSMNLWQSSDSQEAGNQHL